MDITKNLKLESVQENNAEWGPEGNKLIAVVCYFTFFGEEGEAYLDTDRLDGKYPSYGMTEISSELADSFNEMLEKHWLAIVAKVKEYIKEWELSQAD